MFIQILGLVGAVILAKLWGKVAPEALGSIGFAISFISLFSIITDLGYSQAHVKRISEGKDLGICIGTFVTIKILLTCLMVALLTVSILFWKYILNEDFYDSTTESVFVVILLYIIFTTLSSIATQTFIGRKEIARLQLTKMTENLVHIPLMIIVALAGVSGFIISGELFSFPPAISWPEFLSPVQIFFADHPVGSLAMTYTFGTLSMLLIGLWLMRKYPIKKPNWAFFKSYSIFAFPVLISSSVATISHNVDKVMIGYFWTSTEVGYYFTVQRILAFITILYISVSTVLFPTISTYYAEKKYEKMKQTTHLAERYISMITIPPIIFVIIFSIPFIDIILSTAFLPAASVLVFLLIWAFIFGITAPYANIILGIDKPKIIAKITIATYLLNIILNFFIIPEKGILSPLGINGPEGAAFATVISVLIMFFGHRYYAKKFTGIRSIQSHTPRHIIAGAIMGGVLYVLAYKTTLFPVIRWFSLFLFAAIGLIIYISVLFLLKEFKKQDIYFFLNILHPKEMLSYINSEFKTKK
jgi:O-antigen/teichoic acid export membrane protein